MNLAIRQPEGISQARMAPGTAVRVVMAGKASHWGKRETACGVVDVFSIAPVATDALTTP